MGALIRQPPYRNLSEEERERTSKLDCGQIEGNGGRNLTEERTKELDRNSNWKKLLQTGWDTVKCERMANTEEGY